MESPGSEIGTPGLPGLASRTWSLMRMVPGLAPLWCSLHLRQHCRCAEVTRSFVISHVPNSGVTVNEIPPSSRHAATIAGPTLLVLLVSLLLLNCACSVAFSGSAATPNPSAPTSPAPNVNSFPDLQRKKGWAGSALLPTAYTVCSTCNPSEPQAT
ncbi:MAG: hypothetical protein JWO91_958 [Acidobacteriaceae bacterium]|nr:hypothetical protein [Acidobacteriaceae bacterium]